MSAHSRALWVLALCGIASLGVKRPGGLGDVVEVRHWSYPDYTRVVVELSRSTTADVHRLAADSKARRPERLYVDLPGVWVGRRYADPIEVGDGLLQGVRVGQNTLRTTRVVLDLERYERHRILRLSEPERVVIDVYGRRRATGSRGRSGPAREGRLPIDVRGVRTVVIDAGHGGRDPGAIGVGGLQEADVTLRLARRLRPRLESRGFRVVLTRDRDRTMSLEERTAFAAGSGGDLFLSLHANASRRRAAHGIETYYLDESNERQSLRVAARENGLTGGSLDALARTVTKLRVSETSDYSALLAGVVHRKIVSGVRVQYRRLEDLGVKQGPFYVLFLSSMPSALIEVGFVTNRQEARRLRDGAYLDAMAEHIARGLSAYRKQLQTVVARRSP